MRVALALRAATDESSFIRAPAWRQCLTLRDQLAIVKRDATPEEILLQRRALLTDHRYSVFLGLSYTFGSICNSVVNPRFGTGPGHILR